MDRNRLESVAGIAGDLTAVEGKCSTHWRVVRMILGEMVMVMVKKILCVFLSLLVCFGVSGCSYFEGYAPFPTSWLSETAEGGDENGSAVTTDAGQGAEAEQSGSLPQEETNGSATTTTTRSEQHTAAQVFDGFQYSQLNAVGKAVYAKLVDAAERMENVVYVEDCGLKRADAQMVFECFLADNPQFFYVSRQLRYLYEDAKVKRFYLCYTDGETTDTFDAKFKRLTVKADRRTIHAKKAELEKKVAEIVALVPGKATDSEKERVIHDYIVDNVDYDTSITLDNVSVEGTLPHSFDVYGAACEGISVCEGFSKMFQYLCACVGVRATVIQGVANGPHMWNAVCLDGRWYQVDVTWDTCKSGWKKYYGYYNRSAEEMERTHKIDSEHLFVPKLS